MSEKSEAQRATKRKAVTEAALEEQAKAPKRRRRTREEMLQEKMEQEKQKTLERHRKAVAEETKAQEAEETEEAKTAEEPAEDPAMEADMEAQEAPEEAEEQPKLESPTAGLNLEPDLRNMSLSKYMEQLLALSRAETRAIQALTYQVNDQEHKIDSMKDQIKNMGRFERSVGFSYAGSGKWTSPKRIKPCWHCEMKDSRVTLQINRYDNKWMVICENCWTRSEGADGPMQAIKFWNEQKESPTSEMLNIPFGS